MVHCGGGDEGLDCFGRKYRELDGMRWRRGGSSLAMLQGSKESWMNGLFHPLTHIDTYLNLPVRLYVPFSMLVIFVDPLLPLL